MMREQFMDRLAHAIRPRSAATGSALLREMLPLLGDISDELFTDQAITYLATRLKRSPSLKELRTGLEQYSASTLPPPPPPPTQTERDRAAWEDRQEALRRDWDDPAGILRRIKLCQESPRADRATDLLLLLGKLVRAWAPQHVGYLPPHIIEALDIDDDDDRRRYAVERQRVLDGGAMTREEQLEALGYGGPRQAQPRYASPEQLDQINPLPNGHKRAEAFVP
jgi:hypothetical protein